MRASFFIPVVNILRRAVNPEAENNGASLQSHVQAADGPNKAHVNKLLQK